MDIHIAPEKLREIASGFRNRKPYGYAAVGSLFEPSILSGVESRLGQYPEEENLYASRRKYRLSALAGMPARTRNALLFETNDISCPGRADPLQCLEGTFRKSIALYYYTPTRPGAGILFGKSEMTNLVERPSESFEIDTIRRLRHKLQMWAKGIAHSLKKGRDT